MSRVKLLLVFAVLALMVTGLGVAGSGVAFGKEKTKKTHEKTEQEEIKKAREKYTEEKSRDRDKEIEEVITAEEEYCPEGEEKCPSENRRKLKAAERKAKYKYKERAATAKEKYEERKKEIEEEHAPPEEKFTIGKEQEVGGSDAGFTKEKLESEVGKTIDYKITVANTGNTTLRFGALSDSNCTNITPIGEIELGAGKSQTYTCEHELTTANSTENGGIYDNTAKIKAGATEETSNTVEAKVNT